MSPMFDPEPLLSGVPPHLLMFGIGAFGLVIGMLLVRRAAGGTPEANAFRATSTRPVDRLPIVGLAAVALPLAVIAYLALSR